LLEALGNLGDFVGGIAVVATLLYLAVQVRQNSRNLQIAAIDAAHGYFAQSQIAIAQSPDLAELPQATWDAYRATLLYSFGRPGWQQCWVEIRPMFSEGFQQVIHEIVALRTKSEPAVCPDR
jgi:hypothetical protein